MATKSDVLKENYKKVKDFLIKIGINEKNIIENEDENSLEIPLTIEFENSDPIILKTKMLITERWIFSKCLIIYDNKIPTSGNIKNLLYQELLRANFDLAEVTYSLDQVNNIYIETDMPTVTNFENFQSEFQSIPFGVLHFFNDIVPKISNEIKRQNTFDRSMYV
ncbi:MAG: hypothetical protein HWN67_10215 [Candidatus Helarchaeota archaeon]|nr:hypothetical protein [Candidatus Helarchaeota archaeon]